MSRFVLIALVAAMISGLWGSQAMAQRDAGAKARGDMRGFWDPAFRRSPSQTFFYQPARPSSDSYRRFSYQPIGISAGDTVVVQGDDIKLMKGSNVVGSAPQGLEFKVTKVVNGWLGAVVEVDGQQLDGWIWHNHVSLKEQAATAAPQATRQDTQGRSYRRFSYEPSRPTRSYRSRSYEPRKEPWQYPKADPRRYRF